MIKGNLSFRPAFLALAILFTSISAPISGFFTSVSNAYSAVYNKATKRNVAILTFLAFYVRLRTKPTAKYENTAKKDIQEILMALKSFDPAVVSKLVELFDKWIIGQKFSLVDTELDTIQEDGSVLKVHDKKVKTTPFGVFGYIDAYGIQSLELLAKLAESIDKIQKGLASIKIPVQGTTAIQELFN